MRRSHRPIENIAAVDKSDDVELFFKLNNGTTRFSINSKTDPLESVTQKLPSKKLTAAYGPNLTLARDSDTK